MTTEEMAKAYDEMVQRVKELHEAGNFLTKKQMEIICPELAESEDERIRRTLAEYFGPEVQLDLVRGVPIQKIRDWLEKQKEQKPAEWSDEDKKMIERLITRLNRITYNTRTNCTSPNITFFDEIDWLKSLRPQPHWKPSEEQMDCLNIAITDYKEDGDCTQSAGLKSLYNDLKKLI